MHVSINLFSLENLRMPQMSSMLSMHYIFLDFKKAHFCLFKLCSWAKLWCEKFAKWIFCHMKPISFFCWIPYLFLYIRQGNFYSLLPVFIKWMRYPAILQALHQYAMQLNNNPVSSEPSCEWQGTCFYRQIIFNQYCKEIDKSTNVRQLLNWIFSLLSIVFFSLFRYENFTQIV